MHYPYKDTNDIAKHLNMPISSIYNIAYRHDIKKTKEYKQEMIEKVKAKLSENGKKYRFQKGHVPYNTGRSIPENVKEKISKTFFQKGIVPHNTKPVGYESVRIDKAGNKYTFIKVEDKKRMVPKHRHIWEQANGEIPKGHVIQFIDGNTSNCTLGNLRCVTHEVNLYTGSVHKLPVEIAEIIILNKKVKNKIHEKQNT